MKRLLAAILSVLTLWSTLVCLPFSVTADSASTVAEQLPSSYTLTTSSTLPPIDNQGSIGSCVSQAATYMQFTNAVAQYLQSKGMTEWQPATGNDAYIFSPKWTYNYSGSGTLWVYDILSTMGCVTQDVSKFYKNSSGASQYKVGSALKTATTSWDVGSGVMEDALNFRLASYEQIWTKDVASESASGGVTNTAKGQALLNRIKAAVADGNVVLTGGLAGRWTYGKVSGDGDIGKAGDYCIYAAVSSSGGGHQVAIIGYDDNITYTTPNGTTLKGAFQVANSWGTGWHNKGCTWVFYDAVNGVSQYSSDSALSGSNRTWALDQFVFTDWRTDIIVGYPELMLSVDVTTTNRDAVSLTLTRTDAAGNTETYQPRMFYYGDLGYHDNYEVTSPSYLNYAGVKNGAASTAYFTFSYEDLTELPAGKSVNDYVWGFQLEVDQGYTAKVGTITLKDANLKTLFTKTVSTTVTASDSNVKHLFTCSDKCYVLKESNSRYSITAQSGSSSPVSSGGSYSFKVKMASGYTDDFLTVYANGVALTPVNGVYTLNNMKTSVVISASGIVEDVQSKSMSVSMYNGNGWENYGGQYVMVISISNSALNPEIYAKASELGESSYPYYFRLTDKATGISYYMQPASAYYFTSSTLYRLPFQASGFTAEAGKTYNFTVDVVYSGRTLYTGSMSTQCSFSSTVKASGTPNYIRYTVDGSSYATDAFVKGSKTVVREVPTKNGVSGVWKGDTVPETMGSSDLSLKASYGDETYYTITWVTGSGTYTTRCEEGTIPTFSGSTAKASTAAVHYTFAGWNKTVTAATQNTTYTATYTETARSYTVTWVVNGKTTTESYVYGKVPSFKGSTAKASDSSYAYTFTGWDKTLTKVTGNVTYTAQYQKTALTKLPKKGDINGDGSVTVLDVTVLLSYLTDGKVSIERSAADLDGNGSISIADVTLLLVLLKG